MLKSMSRQFMFCGLAVVSGAGSVSAAIIYESATSGPTGQTTGSGNTISDSFYLAVNFEVTTTVETGSVGGHLKDFASAGSVFGAIIRLAGPGDFATLADFSSPNLLGAALIPLPYPSDNVSGNLRLTLQPGWYALVLGSGQLGANGEGGSINNNTPDGVSVIYVIRTSDGAILPQAPGARLFVDSAPVPEFSVIVDTDTLIPGSSQYFRGFSIPAMDGGEIAFFGDGEFGPLWHGVYKTVDGAVTSVANEGTQIPESSVYFTLFRHQPMIDNGAVTFYGGGLGSLRGVYTDVRGSLERVIDSTMTTPGGVDPFAFPLSVWVSMEDGAITFAGRYDTDSEGIYRWRAGAIDVIANLATPIPNGTGTFDALDDSIAPIEAGAVAFAGLSQAEGIGGIYRTADSGLETIYERGTPFPGGGDIMDILADVRMRNDRFAFVAYSATFTMGGIFTDASGTLEPFLTFDTPVPGGTGPFVVFGTAFAFDGVHLAAFGRDADYNQGIFSNVTGELAPVIMFGDQVFQKTVDSALGSEASLEGNKLVFRARFDDGSEGILQARYPSPPGDVDDDGDVDLKDAAVLAACFGGSFQPPAAPDCDAADFNGDTDVDLGDFKAWHDCAGGPVAASPCGY
ncbi:MAG: hypothetical protein GY778_05065 [bacterium]|nr:hypothetical protein [bacterium]